jgi:GNAT superfamily N-acetyltransferase
MNDKQYFVREARINEFQKVGELMVSVYSQLEGFFSVEENPEYYNKLINVGELTIKPKVKLLVAVSADDAIAGGVVYFGDMKDYGAFQTFSQEKNAAGFRLLAVDPTIRSKGIGKLLINSCIQLAIEDNKRQVIIHSTNAMKIAWAMYEKMGFVRSENLDFSKDDFPVFGFRLEL